MEQIKKLKQFKNISKLPVSTQLKYYKTIYFISLAIIVVMGFLSLGATGSNFMIWKDMQTPSTWQLMQSRHNSFFTSQQMIIAFDVICLAMLALLTFSVFKFYTKGNFIIMCVTLVFWIVRWSASIFFLTTDSQLRQQNEKKFALIYTPGGDLNPLCYSQECTGRLLFIPKGQLLNYVECGKILVWKQLHGFQIGYIFITILVGAVVLLMAFRTNKLDVESNEDGIQLEESR